MYILKRIAVVFSIAVLAGVLYGVVTSEALEADGDITSEFALVENTLFVEPITGAVGSGKFKLDGEDLDDLEFWLEIEAEGLMAGKWYYLAATVRENFDGEAVPIAWAVVGMAQADADGKLKSSGTAVLPNVFDPPTSVGVTKWRIDQQLRQLGSGEKGNCVECILVCAPTTKVELHDGELVPFGDGGDDDDDDDDGDDDD